MYNAFQNQPNFPFSEFNAMQLFSAYHLNEFSIMITGTTVFGMSGTICCIRVSSLQKADHKRSIYHYYLLGHRQAVFCVISVSTANGILSTTAKLFLTLWVSEFVEHPKISSTQKRPI